MDQFTALVTKVGNSPKKMVAAADQLMNKLGDTMSGEVEIEVAESLAPLYEAFEELPEDGEMEDAVAKETQELVKKSSPKHAKKLLKAKKKKVRLNLSKVKKVFKKNKTKYTEMTESIMDEESDDTSLLNEDLGVGLAIAFNVSFWVVMLAMAVYFWYVVFLAAKNKHMNMFDTDSKNLVQNILSGIVMVFGMGFLWALFTHLQIKKKLKGESSNESVSYGFMDNDSILESADNLGFDESSIRYDDLSTAEINRAYRIVQADLAHRAPKSTNPME